MAAAAPSLGCFPLKINLFLSLGEKSIRLSSISLVVFPWNKGKSFKNFCWQWWWECKRGKEEERWHLFKKPAAKQQKKREFHRRRRKNFSLSSYQIFLFREITKWMIMVFWIHGKFCYFWNPNWWWLNRKKCDLLLTFFS